MNKTGANGTGAKIILWALIVAMLTFTAVRTIHFLYLTFPPGEQYVAYIGLAAFDVGVLGWFYYATQAVTGAAQRAVAYGMIFVCAAGVSATTVADMTLVSHANGLSQLPQDIGTIGLWAVIIVICTNFLAGIVAHLVDPKHLQHMKEENLRDRIIAATHEHMAQQTDRIAPMIAARLAQHWTNTITAELIGKLPEPGLPSPKVIDG